MNFEVTFETKEQGIKELKERVRLRNQMGGAMYYSILNDDCIEMAHKLEAMGAPHSELVEILNK